MLVMKGTKRACIYILDNETENNDSMNSVIGQHDKRFGIND